MNLAVCADLKRSAGSRASACVWRPSFRGATRGTRRYALLSTMSKKYFMEVNGSDDPILHFVRCCMHWHHIYVFIFYILWFITPLFFFFFGNGKDGHSKMCICCTEMEKEIPRDAQCAVNGMNSLHEGNKCQLRIGPLTKEAAYRCYLRHSVCVNKCIKTPGYCWVTICFPIFHASQRAVKYKLQVRYTITHAHTRTHTQLLSVSPLQ